MSTEFRPPVAAIDFVLNEIVDLGRLATWPQFAHADPATVREALDEAGRLFAEVIAPLNRVGDVQGSRLQPDGSVRTPDGFREAYEQYRASGWGGVGFDPAYGGGGFPWVVTIALQELLCASNKAFALAPLLTQGAIDALLHTARRSGRRSTCSPRWCRGEWTGTMNLTEPHAGSDVGALTTKAVRQDDGTYRITGQKIFITWGEHDLTENIVHLVLARTPDAPAGTKGISCFIVPKFLMPTTVRSASATTSAACRSSTRWASSASPTCVLSFGETTVPSATSSARRTRACGTCSR
jgi:alkylation response protein AidB-like acyl-CoA dehydrogenase